MRYRRSVSGRIIRLTGIALLAVAISPVGASWAGDSAEHTQDSPIVPSRINGRYLLLNHFGETVTDRSFGDRFQLIYFGYTHCPDVCPTSLMTISHALKRMGDKADRVQPLMISVDPERDTPEVLREFVRYFHPRLVGLTGTPEMIERVAQNFRIRYEKVRLTDDPPGVYRMDHSAGVYFMSPDGRFLAKFANSATVEQMTRRMMDFIP